MPFNGSDFASTMDDAKKNKKKKRKRDEFSDAESGEIMECLLYMLRSTMMACYQRGPNPPRLVRPHLCLRICVFLLHTYTHNRILNSRTRLPQSPKPSKQRLLALTRYDFRCCRALWAMGDQKIL